MYATTLALRWCLALTMSLPTATALWRYDTGETVDPSPTVSGGSVFFGGAENVYAIDIASKTLMWQYKANDHHFQRSGVISSPAVSGGTVFFGGGQYDIGTGRFSRFIYAVDEASGSLKWRTETNDVTDFTPAVSGGIVFVSAGSIVMAINVASGAIMWDYDTGGRVECSPVVTGGTISISSKGSVHAIDAGSGSLRWRYYFGSDCHSNDCGTIVAVNDAALFVAGYKTVYMIDVASGTLNWEYSFARSGKKLPAVSENGDIVFVNGWDYVYAIDASSGSLRWRSRMDGAGHNGGAGGYRSAFPLVSGSTVFTGGEVSFNGSRVGCVTAIDVATGAHRWRYNTESQPTQYSSSLAVSGSTVFVGSVGHLYSLSPCSSGIAACDGAGCVAGQSTSGSVFAAPSDPVQCASCMVGTMKAAAGDGKCIACGAGSFSVGAEKESDGCHKTGCKGATGCIDCPDPSWCLGNDTCIPSRSAASVGCSDCTTGYAQEQNDCIQCPAAGTAEAILLPAGVGLAFIAVAAFLVRKFQAANIKAVEHKLDEARHKVLEVAAASVSMTPEKVEEKQKLSEKLKAQATDSMALIQQVAALMSVLTFIQMSVTIVQIDVGWSPVVKRLSEILSRIAFFDLTGVAAPECHIFMSSSARWLLTLMVPICPLLLSILLLGLLSCVPNCCVCFEAVDRFKTKALSFFLVTYLFFAQTACSPFDCMHSPDSDIIVMRDNPGTQCDSDSKISMEFGDSKFLEFGQQAADSGAIDDPSGGQEILNYGQRFGIGCFVLSVCFLAIITIAFVLRGTSKLTDPRFIRTYGALYFRYKTGCYYWELVLLVRKPGLVLITRLASNAQTVQIVGCAVLLGGALLLQHCYKPFLSEGVNMLEKRTLMACEGVVALGAMAWLGVPELAITVLYFMLMITAAGLIAQSLRVVWREQSGDRNGNEGFSAVQVQTNPISTQGSLQ
jgi:outer membrane protein assembly factor BamB